MKEKTIVAIFLIFLFVGIGKISAQTGAISGFIYDDSNNPIADVDVYASTTSGTYYQQNSISQEDGSFYISRLPVGLYIVRVFNKQGYVNEFYKNALQKSEATQIKVNANSVSSNIIIYLEKGGFMSGHLYQKDGSLITTGIEVSFYEADSQTLMGSCISEPDGSFISPALPAGEHVVMAGDTEQGYVITFYNNVYNWNEAELIQIAANDTVPDVDFFLEKGGSVSGYVYEEDNPGKYIKAWIVIEDWDSSQWRSEAMSDSITGYYRASGLRPGKYRVFVFSVDPTKYHTQYFWKNARKNDNNTPVYIKSLNDISANNVNFELVPVTRETLSNEHIQISVSDKYPGTNLTLGTTGGLPDTYLDDNKSLLFGHPSPHTSYTTVRIGDDNFIFGSPEGDYMYENNIFTPENRIVPHITADEYGITWGWTCKFVRIEQTILLVKSEWSEKKIFDTAKIKYVLTNLSRESQEVGLRMLFDTMLGENDGAPIRTPDGVFTDHERDFLKPHIPAWWTAVEGDSTKTIFSAQGTLTGYGSTIPDRFAIVKWQNVFQNMWNYKTEDSCKTIHDSAVAMWWNPVLLGRNESREIVTYYGLGEMIPDTIPPYIEALNPDSNSVVAPETEINLHVKDDYMGVDGGSIKMWVNQQRVYPDTSSDPEKKDYALRYQPPHLFKYNQRVTVQIFAKDRAFIPNELNKKYSFEILKDNEPPFLAELNPDSGVTDVPVSSLIQFHIKDILSGVDSTKIRIIVNSDTVRDYQISGNSNDYEFTIQPKHSFFYNDTVTVKVWASDLAAPTNYMYEEYTFTIQRDDDSPYLDQISPARDMVDVPISSQPGFHIKDDLAGVDSSSLSITINGLPVLNQGITGNPGDYSVSFTPQAAFRYNDTVNVDVQATDLANPANQLIDRYSFTIERDDEPPYVDQLIPAPNEADVPVNTDISFHLKDTISGVDRATIQLVVNDSIYTPVITGDSTDYFVVFNPVQNFRYNDTVSVAIRAADMASPPNVMQPFECSFFIKTDNVSPYITSIFPSENAENIERNTEISFIVVDSLAGVDLQSIRLTVNDAVRTPTIEGDSSQYAVRFQQDNLFFYNETVTVKIEASDLAQPANRIDPPFLYMFYVERDTIPPYFTNINPPMFAKNVELDAAVSFTVLDNHSGVGHVQLFVENEPVNLTTDGNDYLFQPDAIFSEDDTIDIRIIAQDRVIPANIDTVEYYFVTLIDSMPPETKHHVPAKNQQNVDPGTDIKLKIVDDFTGVDSSSIVMRVNNELVSPTLEEINKGYQLSYKPEQDFHYNQTLGVRINGKDRAKIPNAMEADEYYFEIIKDFEPPYVTDMQPVDGDTGVARNSSITFHLKDDVSGVDSSMIRMFINNELIDLGGLHFEGEKSDYLMRYNPDEPFKIGEIIKMKIIAPDFSYPPNIDTTEIQFTISTRKDRHPPYTAGHLPERWTRNVNRGATIQVHIKDDYSGVDENSIVFKVNGQEVIPEMSGAKYDYLLVYQTDSLFRFNDSVLVEIDARDLAVEPNEMETDRYLFYIERDVRPPKIVFTSPGDQQENVPLDTEIKIELFDDQLGIDLASIRMNVYESEVKPDISGDLFNYVLDYRPDRWFKYNEIVPITIVVKDLSVPPNDTTALFHFKTLEDRTPPYVTNLVPEKYAEQVDFDTDIRFQLKDDIAGVDSSTISLVVNGESVPISFSGHKADYEIIYTPEPGFSSGHIVNVAISANDLSNPPNAMETESYHFKIKDILPDLIANISVDSNRVIVHHHVNITANVSVLYAPVQKPFGVLLKMDNQIIHETTIDRMRIDEVQLITVPVTLHEPKNYNIVVEVDPNNTINESNTDNNIVTTYIQAVEGNLIVRSNPFTPNDDGYNDFVGFDFKQFTLNSPVLKIFDFQGRDIITLKKYANSKFVWNGKNKDEKRAQPGLYLYILEDGGRNVARGYVVLAR